MGWAMMPPMRARSLAAMALTLAGLGACREEPTSPDAGGGAAGFGAMGSGGSGGSGGSYVCSASASVVHFITDDGVKLEADDYPTGEAMGPSVVLLHMIPPANDRKNFPTAFLDALTKKKIRVLNVDRRGAGASAGVAADAYLGDKGKLDAKAAIVHLTQGECPVDPLRIGIVGASNGTTTALDYTLEAAAHAELTFPSALVFLTGGAYTENQAKVSDFMPDLEMLPIEFVFAKDEAAWSQGYMTSAPSAWRFEEYDPGGHGTAMFDARPESIETVAKFLSDVL